MRNVGLGIRAAAGVGALVLATSTALASAATNPASRPGAKCPKVGATATVGRTALKCVKIGKDGRKLVWQKAAKSPPVKKSPTPTVSGTQVPTSLPTAQQEYMVNVEGTTWSWSFSYHLDGSKSVLASDSRHSAVLFLPQGKLVHINVGSNDVSHGFWVPGLGIDAAAAVESTSKIDITAAKVGTYPGACNIQCGRGHAGMKLTVEVVSEAEYLKYLSTLK